MARSVPAVFEDGRSKKTADLDSGGSFHSGSIVVPERLWNSYGTTRQRSDGRFSGSRRRRASRVEGTPSFRGELVDVATADLEARGGSLRMTGH